MTTPAQRDTLDLAGPWFLRPDPGNEGEKQNWWRFSDWWSRHSAMHIPGAWQKVLRPDYHGIAWLARIARVPRAWTKDDSHRIRLRFNAVATDAIVQVNGIEVGRHSGDYIPFEFDITDATRLGWQGKAPLNPPSPREINICLRIDEVPGKRPPPGQTVETGHITKGFHDVLSCQHGGIWDDVTLRCLKSNSSILPDGVRITTDPERRRVRIAVDLEESNESRSIAFGFQDSRGNKLGPGSGSIAPGQTRWEREVIFGRYIEEMCWDDDSPEPYAMKPSKTPHPYDIEEWSPSLPRLYTLHLDVMRTGPPEVLVESNSVRFGFRTATTGGPGNSHILLNNKPLLLRAILHWGHEPDHIAPAPTPDQVRAEFKQLRAMGFNSVCLCMWYPPRHYYDIADETGMLIWQEHPVWKSPMEEELIPEYQRLFESFFRRDRNHPSVILVSGSCEHERIHPDLAAWWWKRAKEENPDRLVQIQTAFTAWVNPDQTDLHDEHVYESSGRWVKFCEDLQPALAELPPKPFVMGETIIGTSWLDTAAFARASGLGPKASPWWFPKGLPECLAFERHLESRYGPSTLSRFRATADRQNLATRKFQSEVFRSYPNHAGWVMNQIRDVAPARLGFMDELGRWRFSPGQTLPWLGDVALLLHTSDHRRGFQGGQPVQVRYGVSNFGPVPFDEHVALHIGGGFMPCETIGFRLKAAQGEVLFSQWHELALRTVESPTLCRIRAQTEDLELQNSWDLWLFPDPGDIPEHVVRLDGLPFSRKDLEPDFEERSYSSGWGLKVRTWKAILPLPETVLFKAPLWRFDAPLPPNTRVIVTHKLTAKVLDFLTSGGRVILLASKAPGGLGTKFITLYGQCPLVIEEGPILPGDAPWIEDLLHHDLTRRYTRAIPSEDLHIADQIDPLIRLVFTHDRGIPKLMDSAFMARVGRGLLIATCLDHTEDPGRFLMQRFLEFLASDSPTCPASLDPALARSWTV